MSYRKVRKAKLSGAPRTKIRATVEKRVQDRANKLLGDCTIESLEFAKLVLTSKEELTVKKLDKNGKMHSFKVPKYTTEHKITIIEKILDKSFADKKEFNDTFNSDNPNVIAFNFNTVKK